MSPESNPRAPRIDGERNRAALVAAARRLFDDRGPDTPLNDVAVAAGVANATLYRHFATRADLIVAVYTQEVSELSALAKRLLRATDPAQALSEWLLAFVRHVAAKRDLAQALPDTRDGRRGTLFAEWHTIMHTDAERLLDRAQAVHAVRSEIRATDLLALANGIALTRLPDDRLQALLHVVRHGYAT
jgi:AcrR family transcriptional regulator